MCVALPGRVVELNGTKATVDFSGNTVEAEAGLVKVKIGDRVLVHAGCIIQTMDDAEADELEDLFREIEDIQI
ncbi:HypC/HybG/HupF family hydrogenase formation chaperone [Butyrivibrio sp. WCD3002]|jgi:hydrogenase expression/formation protein HypC|uniref:HypC/HybG/HupF family hydrogenase formation chaperone n=1 Tax=Butyrivibrio sp. WCD3002 TaxID=1280676 RepID=UPI0003FF014D|nr:HypC/HybG/HupF family hydrogenase formation chaperone [Butyrivibrio sp. WCD3002]